MSIDVYSATGQKKTAIELPEDLFGSPINWGLMHQAVLLQQGNRRNPIAHVKTRGEIVGSTKKMFAQKHTGQARRGPSRSPVLRGGGKTFGPRNDANFTRDMPRKMRHAALRSCLAAQLEKNRIVLLESYPDDVKTKSMAQLLAKLPVEAGRRTLVVIPDAHRGVQFSTRNIPGVKALRAAYLNPEDVLNSRAIIFLVDALDVAARIFGKKVNEEATKAKKVKKNAKDTMEFKPKSKVSKTAKNKPTKADKPAAPKKAAPKKAASAKAAKTSKKAAASSESSESSASSES